LASGEEENNKPPRIMMMGGRATLGDAHAQSLDGVTPATSVLEFIGGRPGYEADWIRELALKKGAWAIAAIRSVSAHIFTELTIGSSGSSIRSNKVVGSRGAATGLPPITAHQAMASF
jgi:hypothetical protein